MQISHTVLHWIIANNTWQNNNIDCEIMFRRHSKLMTVCRIALLMKTKDAFTMFQWTRSNFTFGPMPWVRENVIEECLFLCGFHWLVQCNNSIRILIIFHMNIWTRQIRDFDFDANVDINVNVPFLCCINGILITST